MNSINRLRTWLNNMGIEYENDDSIFDNWQIERIKIPSCKDCKLSIIQGYGTYGNENDLMEVWDCENSDEPERNKSLHDVAQLISNRL